MQVERKRKLTRVLVAVMAVALVLFAVIRLVSPSHFERGEQLRDFFAVARTVDEIPREELLRAREEYRLSYEGEEKERLAALEHLVWIDSVLGDREAAIKWAKIAQEEFPQDKASAARIANTLETYREHRGAK